MRFGPPLMMIGLLVLLAGSASVVIGVPFTTAAVQLDGGLDVVLVSSTSVSVPVGDTFDIKILATTRASFEPTGAKGTFYILLNDKILTSASDEVGAIVHTWDTSVEVDMLASSSNLITLTCRKDVSGEIIIQVYFLGDTPQIGTIQVTILQPPRYALTLRTSPPGTGLVTAYPEPEGGYLSGDRVRVTATPSEGYVFDYWVGVDDEDVDDLTADLVMVGDRIVTANFKPEPEGVSLGMMSMLLGMSIIVIGAGLTVKGR